MFRIDQLGLTAGAIDRSRTDGKLDGSLVTLTYTGTGTFRPVFLAVPVDDVASPANLTEDSPGVWTFSPLAGCPGTYRILGIENEGLPSERRVIRLFRVRTASGLIIPAPNERANPLSSLLNASASHTAQSEDNATDYSSARLNALPWSGWWRALYEVISRVGSMPGYVPEPGLVDEWTAEDGVIIRDGTITQWVGKRGNMLLPLTSDMVLETARFSGGRKAVSFDGATQGMRCSLPQVAFGLSHVTVFVQYVLGAVGTTVQLWALRDVSGIGGGRVEMWKSIDGNVHLGGANGNLDIFDNSGWTINTERTRGGTRGTSGNAIMFLQGSDVASAVHATTSIPDSSSLLLGFGYNGGVPAFFFNGSIRRVAVYCTTFTEAQALAWHTARFGV